MSRSSRKPIARRLIRPPARVLLGLIAAVVLAAACTEPTNDIRSPAPTGSLTPATSTGASASP